MVHLWRICSHAAFDNRFTLAADDCNDSGGLLGPGMSVLIL